jgi:hypothetical protein
VRFFRAVRARRVVGERLEGRGDPLRLDLDHLQLGPPAEIAVLRVRAGHLLVQPPRDRGNELESSERIVQPHDARCAGRLVGRFGDSRAILGAERGNDLIDSLAVARRRVGGAESLLLHPHEERLRFAGRPRPSVQSSREARGPAIPAVSRDEEARQIERLVAPADARGHVAEPEAREAGARPAVDGRAERGVAKPAPHERTAAHSEQALERRIDGADEEVAIERGESDRNRVELLLGEESRGCGRGRGAGRRRRARGRRDERCGDANGGRRRFIRARGG